MSPRTQILLLLAIPLVLVVGLVLTSQRLPSSEVGRAYVQRVTLPSASDDLDLPSVSGDEALPLVVIDAGHGGHDPGASGQGLVEKSLVLSLALALKIT